MTQDGKDNVYEADPWSIRNSKGRVRPEVPEARTLAHFMPPGLSSIVPKESPAMPKESPSESPQEQPPLVEQSRIQSRLSRAELEKGLDLITELLDEQTVDEEKRERALELAEAAGVPWRTKRGDLPGIRRPRMRHKNRFCFDWCDCSDGENCPKPGGESGF